MDCFVAEPVIGLAEGETRWLLQWRGLGPTGGFRCHPTPTAAW